MMHVLVSTRKGWSERFGRIVDGTPRVSYSDGCWQEERMRQLRIHLQDVMATVRGQGVEWMEQIKYVIVERNGGISVLKRDG
jgi:uncharacterized membrane protein YcaP (DUF421 family)